MENEVWMRGQIPEIPILLQPVVHALLQVNEDVQKLITDDLEPYIWIKPFSIASIAFHLQHIVGVTDRMMTYSKGKGLIQAQFEYLASEGKFDEKITIQILKQNLEDTILYSIDEIRKIDPLTLTEERFLGRKQIPTTQVGLLFHSAEHAQRHYGQLLVTVKTIKGLLMTGSIH